MGKSASRFSTKVKLSTRSGREGAGAVGAAMVVGEARRQDEAEPAAAANQRERALEEQLIEVGMAVPWSR